MYEQCSKELRKFSYHFEDLRYELLLINTYSINICVYMYIYIHNQNLYVNISVGERMRVNKKKDEKINTEIEQ